VGDINEPMPPYPEEARKAGIEGDLELVITVSPHGEVVGAPVTKSVDSVIDEAALDTVRTWKFKVTRGEQWGFPIKFLYRMACDSLADKMMDLTKNNHFAAQLVDLSGCRTFGTACPTSALNRAIVWAYCRAKLQTIPSSYQCGLNVFPVSRSVFRRERIRGHPSAQAA
jgi:TonB family protein